jgi:hypothetical protein
MRLTTSLALAALAAASVAQAAPGDSAFTAAGQPSIALAVGTAGTKSFTECFEFHCVSHRDDTVKVMARSLRDSGYFYRVDTAGFAEYSVQADFYHEFRDPTGARILKLMLSDANASSDSAYQRVFKAKFNVMRDGVSVGTYSYELAPTASDPNFLGHTRARNSAVDNFVARFLADAARDQAFGTEFASAARARVGSAAPQPVSIP